MDDQDVIWMIPGILGSELHIPGTPQFIFGGNKLWINPIRLGPYGQMEFLQGPLAGGADVPLNAGGPLPDVYQLLWSFLRRHAEATGRRAIALGYDWRQKILFLGADFAGRIRSMQPQLKHTLVCHSMGGLVARAAWRELGATFDTDRVRRIITLGTPHYGSYGIVRVFTLTDPSVVQAARMIAAAQAGPFGRVLLEDHWRLQIARVAATWPSMYELLPHEGKGDAGDPLRNAIYTLGNYPNDRGLSQEGLTDVRLAGHQYLDEAWAIPPAEVLTLVAGEYDFTPTRVHDVTHLGRSDKALGWSQLAGDTQVARWSSQPVEFPGRRYNLKAQHHHLPTAAIPHLAQWIEEETPVGPPVDLPGPPVPSRESPARPGYYVGPPLPPGIIPPVPGYTGGPGSCSG